ncbi:MAG: hypothetical protein HRT64_01450 [Erythrobacter sp.]|nr:hypothetical protein [Erythrobacter sp.]
MVFTDLAGFQCVMRSWEKRQSIIGPSTRHYILTAHCYDGSQVAYQPKFKAWPSKKLESLRLLSRPDAKQWCRAGRPAYWKGFDESDLWKCDPAQVAAKRRTEAQAKLKRLTERSSYNCNAMMIRVCVRQAKQEVAQCEYENRGKGNYCDARFRFVGPEGHCRRKVQKAYGYQRRLKTCMEGEGPLPLPNYAN